MSANQIPFFGPKPEEIPGRPRPHACPRCIYMGGTGHTLRELSKLRRNELDYQEETRILPAVRACGYWSAKTHHYCGDTRKVRLFPGIGQRCVNHDPDVLAHAYKLLVELNGAAQ